MTERSARTLQARVLEQVRVQRLWNPGERVTVAVSGGVDSMVLMHILHRTARAHGGRITVVSVDHGLRPESAREVEMVRAQCVEVGLPCLTKSLDIAPGSNLAERARDARREVLCSVKGDVIATAHHQDDQAETVLYHLLRGSGAQGLKGMAPRNGRWVRPLIRERKDVLRAWATAEGIQWVEDPSNPLSQRGALRRILPSLDAIHGGSSNALARTARLLAREDELVSSLADEAWSRVERDGGLDRDKLSQEAEAIQLRLLRRLIQDHRVRADPLEAILAGALMSPGRLDLGHGLTLICSGGRLVVGRKE